MGFPSKWFPKTSNQITNDHIGDELPKVPEDCFLPSAVAPHHATKTGEILGFHRQKTRRKSIKSLGIEARVGTEIRLVNQLPMFLSQFRGYNPIVVAELRYQH